MPIYDALVAFLSQEQARGKGGASYHMPTHHMTNKHVVREVQAMVGHRSQNNTEL